jgi:hypothetical protein
VSRVIDIVSVCLIAVSLFLIVAPCADVPSGTGESGGILWNTLRPLFWLGVALGVTGIATPLLVRLVAKLAGRKAPRNR